MADNFGVSFVPGAGSGPGGQSRPGSPPVQQAMQLLALRLPKVPGPNSFTSPDLLPGAHPMAPPPHPLQPILDAIAQLAGVPRQSQATLHGRSMGDPLSDPSYTGTPFGTNTGFMGGGYQGHLPTDAPAGSMPPMGGSPSPLPSGGAVPRTPLRKPTITPGNQPVPRPAPVFDTPTINYPGAQGTPSIHSGPYTPTYPAPRMRFP